MYNFTIEELDLQQVRMTDYYRKVESLRNKTEGGLDLTHQGFWVDNLTDLRVSLGEYGGNNQDIVVEFFENSRMFSVEELRKVGQVLMSTMSQPLLEHMSANLNKLIVRLEEFSFHGMDFIQQLEEAICLYTGNVLHSQCRESYRGRTLEGRLQTVLRWVSSPSEGTAIPPSWGAEKALLALRTFSSLPLQGNVTPSV
jgi:hypothetical protein